MTRGVPHHQQAFPRIFVAPVEDADAAAIVGSDAHETVTPYMVDALDEDIGKSYFGETAPNYR
jgi:hypothetical protein